MTTAAAEDAARTPFASRSGSQRQIAEGFTLVDRDGVSYRIKYWRIETVRHYPAVEGGGGGEEQVQFCTADRFEFTLTGPDLETLADDIHEKRAPPRLGMTPRPPGPYDPDGAGKRQSEPVITDIEVVNLRLVPPLQGDG
jgi:hypothetical protein